MNKNLQQLYSIAEKPKKLILGLMSGTSLDGLDMALCRIEGTGLQSSIELLKFYTYPYSSPQKHRLKEVVSQEDVSLQDVTILHAWLAELHARFVLETLEQWGIDPTEIDLLASHGQTVYHAPQRLHNLLTLPNATLQLGDGDHLAVKTGILTISDFRQKHMATGLEGAPLAPYADYMLFSKRGINRILLNIGGIANFTYLPASLAPQEVFATDTGPGNCLIDWAMQHFFSPQTYDRGGSIAQQGTVNKLLLDALKSHLFFTENLPKTTGAELFNKKYIAQVQKQLPDINIPPEDWVTTLTRFTAETIAEAILRIPDIPQAEVIVSGGGYHNVCLMGWLEELLPHCVFVDMESLSSIVPDAKEAVLMAVLANECVAGEGYALGEAPALTMGKVSFA
ncbi:anhydro-N-acetylmuramic acid kinase [Microscilla marina]|uniref:Putative molecular chaperone n=1 Tax=Microscilla marina ATCC 23134 TaxID=313606 RepID=A1ZQ33_MICM2|nr:anhydro-N-acetylmuramic acid kinase [Microscilla marina]EAY27442.1 putative molecular chaperone [Microscilla marina ATCC 23134]